MLNETESSSLESRMTAAQWTVIGLSIFLMALDGFDVLSISFASPGIAAEWGLNFAELGWVLSLELFGMAVGAVANGLLADRAGRRPVLLGCLLMTAVGMAVAGHAASLAMLASGRIVTGLGIGGILVCTNSMAAEFSNRSMRTLCIALVGAGYPLGAASGGFAAAALMGYGGWRYVFNLGATLAVLILPIAYWVIPESPSWLQKRVLNKHGAARSNADGAWTKALVLAAVLVTATYLLHVFSFYFLLKWIPRILTAGGYSAAQAAGVLAWANVGGMVGGISLGLLAVRLRAYSVTIALLLGSAIAIVTFGLTTDRPGILIPVCIFAGFTCNGAILGIYSAIANAFPVELRATGTGIAIGVGRFGAVLAPIVAGYLLQVGLGVPMVSTIMASGSLIAAAALYLLERTRRSERLDLVQAAYAAAD